MVHLTNGFIFIGEYTGTNQIKKCFNVRRYGTTQGEGQLAVSGGTKDTILDFHGSIEYNPKQLLFATPLLAPAEEWFEKHLQSYKAP